MTPDLVSNTINEVLSNRKYKKNAKITQALLNDHLVEPRDQFLYWVKYIIRTNGAKHLISEFAHDLSFVEFWSLDVYFVIVTAEILAAVLIITVLCYIIKLVMQMCSKNKIESKADCLYILYNCNLLIQFMIRIK